MPSDFGKCRNYRQLAETIVANPVSTDVSIRQGGPCNTYPAGHQLIMPGIQSCVGVIVRIKIEGEDPIYTAYHCGDAQDAYRLLNFLKTQLSGKTVQSAKAVLVGGDFDPITRTIPSYAINKFLSANSSPIYNTLVTGLKKLNIPVSHPYSSWAMPQLVTRLYHSYGFSRNKARLAELTARLLYCALLKLTLPTLFFALISFTLLAHFALLISKSDQQSLTHNCIFNTGTDEVTTITCHPDPKKPRSDEPENQLVIDSETRSLASL